MKKFKAQSIVFILILFSFLLQGFLVGNSVQASELLERQEGFESGEGEVPGAFGGDAEPKDIRQIVVDILKVMFTFLGSIMVLLIMYGGYLWMTAGGNEEQVTSAKKYIRNAIIGIVIILASYAITTFVASSIAESSGIEGGVSCINNIIFNV